MLSIKNIFRSLMVMSMVSPVTADIITYSVSGFTTDGIMLTGLMDFSDQYSGGILPGYENLEASMQFSITGFNFTFGDQKIKGSGCMSYHFYGDDSDPINCEFDPLCLRGSNIAFELFDQTDLPVFYHEDGTQYSECNPHEYTVLPERVVATCTEVTGPGYNGRLSWEWNRVKSVPEPGAVLLTVLALIFFVPANFRSKAFKLRRI